MSDQGVPSGPRGGPLQTRGGAPSAGSVAPGTSPSAVAGGSPAIFRGANDPSGREDELYHPRYSLNAHSPVPYMVAALVAGAAAWWAMDWSKPTLEATDPVRSSEWWTNITGVLLPAEDIRFASYSASRMWITLGLLVLTAILVAVWIGRIGTNLRTGDQPFGSLLPILTFPAWWLLPISIGLTGGAPRSRGDVLLRFLTASGILIAQCLLLRWPTLNRIWRAGRLPYDLASIVLWLPMMIPWLMLFGSNAYSVITVDEGGSLRDSSWQPTETMADWARAATRVTSVAILVLLVVVTVVQHISLRRDRAAVRASKELSRAARVPLLPPGAWRAATGDPRGAPA